MQHIVSLERKKLSLVPDLGGIPLGRSTKNIALLGMKLWACEEELSLRYDVHLNVYACKFKSSQFWLKA